jgi:hypothetical protein
VLRLLHDPTVEGPLAFQRQEIQGGHDSAGASLSQEQEVPHHWRSDHQTDPSGRPGRWEPLWHGYLDFYRAVLTPEVTERTWAALCDPASAVHGLVAE